MPILPSPTGGTIADVIYRFRLRAALHLYRSRRQPLPLWRLRQERTGVAPGEEDVSALMAWVGFEQARLAVLLEFVPIGAVEHATIRLADGYELDPAGRSLLQLAFHLHEQPALRGWLDDGVERDPAQTWTLLAGTVGHPYVDVVFALQMAKTLYDRAGEGRPTSMLRLAPHALRVLAEAHTGAFDPENRCGEAR